MRAHIIYFNYLNPDGNGMSIGGIQTYITNLIPVLIECGYEVSVYQRSIIDFHKDMESYDVYGISQPENYGRKVSKALLAKALLYINRSEDLLVYGCETCITKKVACRTVAIQHGISWDIPFEKCSKSNYFRHYLGKCLLAWRTNKRVNKVDHLICVDYNFVNWHRAISPYTRTKHVVIPNFSALPPQQPEKKHQDNINIIFARRFFIHRGTRLFTNVAKSLLSKHANIYITIAGTGPDADYIHRELDSFQNVNFITYNSEKSLKIHQDKDIAVIPTIASEGTSLSLLDTMAAGCAVICTNVGGMTNIIIDGYNGLMINPDEDSLYKALDRLIEDKLLRGRLQAKAYETIKEAFSLNIWKSKWAQIIKNIKQTPSA